MKKLLILSILALLCIEANAQFFTGLAFDISWSNSGDIGNAGTVTQPSSAYNGTISPQFGYVFNPKWMVGSKINLVFDKVYSSEQDKEGKNNKYVSSSIGWDIAPFGRYKLMEFGENGWFSIWADLHVYYGIKYPRNINESGYITKEFNKIYAYGIQGMPALGFKINDHSTLFINVAILSLGYSGTRTDYGN